MRELTTRREDVYKGSVGNLAFIPDCAALHPDYWLLRPAGLGGWPSASKARGIDTGRGAPILPLFPAGSAREKCLYGPWLVMFAVIRTGGKQYRVVEGDRIVVERLDAEAGDLLAFDQVLMLAEDGKEPLVGAAVPSEARVFGRVLGQTRGPKVIVFKKKRRKNYRRTKGHRQDLTAVRIVSISPSGAFEAEAAAAESIPAAEPEVENLVVEAAVEAGLEPALQE